MLSDSHLNIDETIQKLLEPEKHRFSNIYDRGIVSKRYRMVYFKTYVGEAEDSPRDGTRAQVALDEEIRDFAGESVQSDGYGAYGHVGERLGKEIENVYCMAHLRRKFYDALNYCRRHASHALSIIKSMYSDEGSYRREGLDKKQIEKRRKQDLRPKLDKFNPSLMPY